LPTRVPESLAFRFQRIARSKRHSCNSYSFTSS